MAEVGHVEVPVTVRFQPPESQFDGEVPVTLEDAQEFCRTLLPKERFGLSRRVSLVFDHPESYVEVEHLGMTEHDVKAEVRYETGEHVVDVYSSTRRYGFQKVTADDDAV
jgi:hypothetical protein